MNWVCRQLEFDQIIVQPKSPEKGKALDKSPDSSEPEYSVSRSKKQKLDYILLNDSESG